MTRILSMRPLTQQQTTANYDSMTQNMWISEEKSDIVSFEVHSYIFSIASSPRRVIGLFLKTVLSWTFEALVIWSDSYKLSVKIGKDSEKLNCSEQHAFPNYNLNDCA
jgi:hypothetical protein